MLKTDLQQILLKSKRHGWIMEPDAKRMLSDAGVPVTRFEQADTISGACRAAGSIGYPVVAKIISPAVIHKSDTGGVVVGIRNDQELRPVFELFSKMPGFKGMLVEEMVSGVELIVGAQYDFQFGPVVLLGIGGTGVEIYGDTALRMAPLESRDVTSMVGCLIGGKLLTGFRGAPVVDHQQLTRLLLNFSEFVMALENQAESIDLNPVMCSGDSCIVADARIMLIGQ